MNTTPLIIAGCAIGAALLFLAVTPKQQPAAIGDAWMATPKTSTLILTGGDDDRLGSGNAGSDIGADGSELRNSTSSADEGFVVPEPTQGPSEAADGALGLDSSSPSVEGLAQADNTSAASEGGNQVATPSAASPTPTPIICTADPDGGQPWCGTEPPETVCVGVPDGGIACRTCPEEGPDADIWCDTAGELPPDVAPDWDVWTDDQPPLDDCGCEEDVTCEMNCEAMW